MAHTTPIEERGAGEVADEGVAPVDVAVEELQRLGQLVVDLEDRRDAEQHEEREVDEAVHDPGGGIAQQGLHVDAGPEVLEPALDVLAWWWPGRSGAPRSQLRTRWPKSTAP